MEIRINFEIFKSNVCHLVKSVGELNFIITMLETNKVRKYWEKDWYAEAFYVLAMVDYLSRKNELPMCDAYDDIRRYKLKEPLFPQDVNLVMMLDPESDIKDEALKNAIPEFWQFHIVEVEPDNIV